MRELIRRFLNPTPRNAHEIKELYFMNFKVDELKAHRRAHQSMKLDWRKGFF